MRVVVVVVALVLAGIVAAAQPPATPLDDPTPQTLDEFRAAAARVLEETGVPGAGISLVTVNGTEWAGGIGWADRDARVPVTEHTHFRAGSISKSFVALGLVQLYEDGMLNLDAEIASLLPEVAIDNPWAAEAPITVRHVLEHTAGFDDMHLSGVYVLDDAPPLPLAEVFRRFPAPQRVRWRPGTRMSYSNPGYGIAGLLLETVAGKPYEQFIRERTFTPLDMTTSGFDIAPEDDALLAKGYADRHGPPVVPRRIHLRPAGALITSAAELAHFVEALLGWGERSSTGGYVVDPEYQSNMEWPRTTVASRAGVRSGYGMGISSTITLPYHVLGHNGGIDGFLSTYGYSPSRDVGYVVLVNSTHAPEAVTRLASLALRYLKRDVEPPARPSLAVAPGVLRSHEGYYRDLSPRQELLRPVRVVMDGFTVRVEGDRLVLDPDFGSTVPLVPVEQGLFRREHEIDASLSFTTAPEGHRVLTGPGLYAEEADRAPVLLLRASLAAAAALVVVAPVVALGRRLRGRRRAAGPATFRGLGVVWLLALATLGAAIWIVAGATPQTLGAATPRALTLFAASTAYPVLAAAALVAALAGLRHRASVAYGLFAVLTGAAHVGLATFLGWFGLLAFRSWTY